jgi:glycosyltransferase involved in cell wall biosynthesis
MRAYESKVGTKALAVDRGADRTPMRVLQVVQTPQRRGAEIFAYDLSIELEKEGMITKIVYLYEYKGQKAIALRDMDVCLGGSPDHILERSLGFQPKLLYKLKREIELFRPDIVQVNGARSVKYGAMVKLFSFLPKRWKLIYRTITIPSHWQRNRLILRLYRLFIMPQMDGVVSVCTPGLDDANQLYGFDVPSTVVLNGFDPTRLRINSTSRRELRARYGACDEDIILLFVGSLISEKRPDRFVRLIASIAKRDPRCYGWIVGDGHLRDETERQAQKLGIENKIRFFGYQEDIGSFMNASELYVLTSDTEGLPATVLEAGFLGVPVVSTDVGGVYEGVLQGETGVLVPRDDEGALSDASSWLAHDKMARDKMAERARDRFEAAFTIGKIAREYVGFYRCILSS